MPEWNLMIYSGLLYGYRVPSSLSLQALYGFGTVYTSPAIPIQVKE
jgi:hypothetical protein